MKRVAGAELNVATGLARLGLKVGWVSRVGKDSFGRFVLHSLAKEGIDARGVSEDSRYATGFQMKSKVENGTDPIVEYFRKGSAASHLSPEDFRAEYFTSARHLHLSGVAAALSESSYALLEQAATTMKAGEDDLVRSESAPGAVEKRSRDGGKTQSAGVSGRLGSAGSQRRHDPYRPTDPGGIADFYLTRGVQAVIIKTGGDGAGSKPPQANRAQSPPSKSITSWIPWAPAMVLPSA